MKRLLTKFDQFKLGHKLHQLQKRYKRALLNHNSENASEYKRRIEEIQEKLRNIK